MRRAYRVRQVVIGKIGLVFGAILIQPAVAAVDLDRVPEPAVICQALRDDGIGLSATWRESRAIRGGWVCDPASASLTVGTADGQGRMSRLSFRVLGSRPNKIDRIILQLDFGAFPRAPEPRDALIEMGERIATVLGFKLPAAASARIRGESVMPRADWSPMPSDSGRRVVYEERQGWVRIRVAVEQSSEAALILSFENPNASNLWN